MVLFNHSHCVIQSLDGLNQIGSGVIRMRRNTAFTSNAMSSSITAILHERTHVGGTISLECSHKSSVLLQL